MEEKNEVQVAEQRTPVKVNFDSKTIETVKQTVFTGATDSELQLYLYKCVASGVHPLDQMIWPMVYNTKDGRKVVFIKSIDLFRSNAESSGEYDGQDEIVFTYLKEESNHPFSATAKVYRKNMSRPTVVTCKWSEFFPENEFKQKRWLQMPEVMLGKCTEAQALRKGFPKQLHGDYIEAEMDQAKSFIPIPLSDKPLPTIPTTTKKTTTSKSGTERAMPTEEERKKNGYVSEKQGWFIYSKLKNNGIDEDNFLKIVKKQSIFYLFKRKDILDKIINKIDNEPGYFKGEVQPPKPQEVTEPEKVEPPVVMDDSNFVKEAMELANKAGIKTKEELNKLMGEAIKLPDVTDIDNILANQQSTVIDFLKFAGKL